MIAAPASARRSQAFRLARKFRNRSIRSVRAASVRMAHSYAAVIYPACMKTARHKQTVGRSRIRKCRESNYYPSCRVTLITLSKDRPVSPHDHDQYGRINSRAEFGKGEVQSQGSVIEPRTPERAPSFVGTVIHAQRVTPKRREC